MVDPVMLRPAPKMDVPAYYLARMYTREPIVMSLYEAWWSYVVLPQNGAEEEAGE